MNTLLQRKEDELPTRKGPGAPWHAHTLPHHQVSQGRALCMLEQVNSKNVPNDEDIPSGENAHISTYKSFSHSK